MSLRVAVRLWSLALVLAACGDDDPVHTFDAATLDALTLDATRGDAAADATPSVDGSSLVPDASGDGGSCANVDESCTTVDCCGTAHCCEGIPLQPGEEYCAASGDPCPISDRNRKEAFAPVDADAILRRVASLPIGTWRYIGERGDVRHLGPMAQDFKSSFGLGTSDRSIFSIDADGVALVSIQALYRRLQALDEQNALLREQNADLRQRLERLERGPLGSVSLPPRRSPRARR